MLSRVAECVYWMGRYAERAENVARFVDVNQELTVAGDLGRGQWQPLVEVTGDRTRFQEMYGEATRENVLRFLVFDKEYPNSIRSCLARARENARTVRENISTPMWEVLNRAYLTIREAAGDPAVLASPYEFLEKVRLASQTLWGVTDTTMSQGEAWHFVRLGRLLERADKTSRILDVKYFVLLPRVEDVGTTLDVVQWSALLNSVSALEMYRKRHGRILPERVVGFLLFDRDFARSVRFALVRAEQSLHEITGTSPNNFSNRAEQLLGRLRSQFDFSNVDDVFERGLHEFVDDFQCQLNGVGGAIHGQFFARDTELPPTQFQTQS